MMKLKRHYEEIIFRIVEKTLNDITLIKLLSRGSFELFVMKM